MDIKSIIRDCLLRNYVVNVLCFKTCKLSKYSIEISEDPMFLGNKLPRSDARHVKSVQSALRDLLTTSATHGTFSRSSGKLDSF